MDYIDQAFEYIVGELDKMRTEFKADMAAHPEDFNRSDRDDAIVWFIEGLS